MKMASEEIDDLNAVIEEKDEVIQQLHYHVEELTAYIEYLEQGLPGGE